MTTTPTTPDLVAAQAEAEAARARLFATIGAVQDRLRPTNLVQDAVEGASHTLSSVARKGAEAARTRPVAVAAIAGTIGLYLARGWIGDILRRRRTPDETPAAANGLDPEIHSAPRAKKGIAR